MTYIQDILFIAYIESLFTFENIEVKIFSLDISMMLIK